MEQRKGRAAEREICGILNGMGFQVRPGEAVSFGREADIVGLENIHAEIKRREAVDLSAALTQASTDAAYFGGLPAVFHRGNRQKWRVTMTLDSWITLYKWAVSGDFGRSEPTERLGNTSDQQTTKSACSAD